MIRGIGYIACTFVVFYSVTSIIMIAADVILHAIN